MCVCVCVCVNVIECVCRSVYWRLSVREGPNASVLLPLYGIMLLFNYSKIVPMDYVGEEYYRMRNTVNKYERYILKVMYCAVCNLMLIGKFITFVGVGLLCACSAPTQGQLI